MKPYASQQKWRILHFAWIAFCSTFVAWFALPPLIPFVQKDLGLSNSQIGWLATAGVLLTIPGRLIIGPMVDRFGPRKVYSLLMAFTALPVAALGLAGNFQQMFALRLLIGLVGCGFVVGIRLVVEWFPTSQLGWAEGIYGGWGNAGSAISAMALPVLAGWWGWRPALACAAVPMFVWSFIFWRGVSDVPAGKVYRRQPREQTYAMWRDPRALSLSLAYWASFGSELCVIAFLPKFFKESFDFSIVRAGLAASIFGNLNFIARPAGGWLADRFGRRRVLMILLFGMAGGYALLGAARSPVMAILALALSALFVNSANGACFAIVPLVSPTNTGKLTGLVGAAGNLGAVIFPLVFGYGLQWSGSYVPGFLTVAGAGLIGAVAVMRSALPEGDQAEAPGYALRESAEAPPRVQMRFARSGLPE